MRVVLAFAVNSFFNFIIGLMVARFLGPAEYGRFALALALGIVVQTAFFDWLKLAATRFYSQRSRETAPELRATLDLAYAVLTCAATLAIIAIVFSGFEFQLSNALVGLAFATAIANGLFDYNTALVRARFMDHHYARLVIVKNIAALLLTGGGAFWFGSAQMTLMGTCLALAGSVVSVRLALHDPQSPPRLASAPVARRAIAYAFPVIAANVLYQLVPFFNRGLIAEHYGFAESGQFSLAFDIGIRIVAAIGSTLDVLLFQIAVALDETHGPERARGQIARNFAIVLAIVAPACAGLWLTLPSIEYLVVPHEFHGPFAHYLGLLLPGLFCYALLYYGLNPVFQIARRTAPLVLTALVASVADVLVVLALPRGTGAGLVALVQGGMFMLAFAVLAGFAIAARTPWPLLREALWTAIATAAMFAALLPLRAAPPGGLTLALQIVAGILVYGGFTALFDIAGLRSNLLRWKQKQPGGVT